MPIIHRNRGRGEVQCLVTLPNTVVHHISLHKNALGLECLNKICSVLGIVECDYFGLRYTDRHGICLWLNNRVKLTAQLQSSQHPYQLHFRVKYYIDPKMIQQPTTRSFFYQQIKALMLNGQLPVPSRDGSKVGALIAQADLGDCQNSNGERNLCYPQYFKEWDPGMANAIAKEHTKLKGMGQNAAIVKLLNEAFQMENWGVNYIKVASADDNSSVYLGIGGFNIRLCNGQWRLLKKISYNNLLEASFRNCIFTISYSTFDTEGQQTDKRFSLRCPNHRIARHLFRSLTEDHTFFTHESVSSRIQEHLRQTPWSGIMKRVLGSRYERLYHFDIMRTRHEAYTHAWERLHQINQEDLNTTLSQRRSSSSTDEESTHDTTNLDSSLDGLCSEADNTPLSPLLPSLTKNDLIKFGLSKSSCDIAKELLEESSQSCVPLSQESTTASLSKAANMSSSSSSLCQSRMSLTKEGTVKLGLFIQKIIDARICRVCMDRPVSATFCPCGHLMACYECAAECAKCPMCRSHIAYVQYVYGTGL